MQKRLHLLFAMLTLFVATAMAQITTSGISGKVTSEGEAVIGASITAIHEPSGTVYRAVTNARGRYTIQGMRAGGPYKVEVTYVGHQPKTFNGVQLLLGEMQTLSCSLEEDAKLLDELVVTGKSGLNATKTGAAMSISAEQINNIPSVSHSIADIARMTPQVTTNQQSGAISIAGTNNRYNSFQIDGAMNNDVFGLTSNGANGGQAGTNPVSMETIEQIQVNVAPFDVRQSGFTGGAINAITKSGTNQFHGSAYGFGNNQDLVGKKYKMDGGGESRAVEKEKEYLYGFTLGGPIVKDKLFFFANFEKANKEYPTQYGLGAEGSKVPADLATDILRSVEDLAQSQGVDYHGVFSDKDRFVKSTKAGLKLDWNINDFNKLTLRWSLVDASQLNGLGSISALNTVDHLYEFQSNTNSFIAELQSRLSSNVSNEARASYVRVRDKRTSGNPFPSVTVYSVGKEGGSVNIGNEYSSMANGLDQDIFTLEDNLNWYKGNHTYTFGTHNEFYKFSNIYLPNLFGCYYFNSYDDFKSYYQSAKSGQPDGSLINRYYFGQANVEVTGDPRWAAKFGAGQLGFYVQDKWNVSDNVQITYGLRMDLPLFFDTPAANAGFNQFAAQRGWEYRTDHKMATKPMWSPRVGFRWNVLDEHRLILRGGAGLFSGRIPFVWLSNNFSNTGVQLSSYQVNAPRTKDISLILDPDRQTINGDKLSASSGSQLINVFDKDFKFAQTLRFNLGADFKAFGIDWTAEAIYSKTLNDVVYSNIAYDETGKTLGQTSPFFWDNRPMFTRITTGTPYNNIYLLSNTSRGYSYNLSLKAEKHFDFGLDLMASYTYSKSKAVASVTSSVAQSNWRNTHTYRNSNDPELTNSAFNMPHSVKASAFYHFSYGRNKMFTTTIGLVYEGHSGSPYSIIYSGDINGDDGTSNDLFFIPTDEQIDLMPFEPTSDFSEEQQRANLKQWLGSQRYLKDHRGEYYERYADNLPFESHFDLHVAEKFNLKIGRQIHSLELSLDIMNVANMLNKNWGVTRSTGYVSEFMSPVTYSSGKFQFARNADYVLKYASDYYSRWRGQIGLKYTF